MHHFRLPPPTHCIRNYILIRSPEICMQRLRNTDVENVTQITDPRGEVLTYPGCLKTTLTSPHILTLPPLTLAPAMISSSGVPLNQILPVLWSLAQHPPLLRSQARSSYQGVIVPLSECQYPSHTLSILDYNFYEHNSSRNCVPFTVRVWSDSCLYLPKPRNTLQSFYHKRIPQDLYP